VHKGFFGSLFDLSFSSLVTTKVIKLLYILTLVAIGVYDLGLIVLAFKISGVVGALTLLIVVPVFSVFAAVYARVLLEFVIAIFRIMENTGEQVELARRQIDGAGPAPTPPPVGGPFTQPSPAPAG
jgi:hypothetical protein